MFKKLVMCNVLFWIGLSIYLDKQIRDNYPSQHSIQQLARHSFIRGCIMQVPDFTRCKFMGDNYEQEVKHILELKPNASQN